MLALGLFIALAVIVALVVALVLGQRSAAQAAHLREVALLNFTTRLHRDSAVERGELLRHLAARTPTELVALQRTATDAIRAQAQGQRRFSEDEYRAMLAADMEEMGFDAREREFVGSTLPEGMGG